MPSVAVTGATRGLGYAFVKYYTAQADTKVFALVRNVEATQAKYEKEGLTNVSIVHADMSDYKSIHDAAEKVGQITGGSLDLLINNAAFSSDHDNWKGPADVAPADLEDAHMSTYKTNVLGVAHTTNAFLPLIRKGQLKKVITISSGMADDELINQFSIPHQASYSMSKSAVNTLVAKYNAAYGKKEGILFLAISPGLVDTGFVDTSQLDQEQQQVMQHLMGAFSEYAPDFKGPIQPDESAGMVADVIDKATVETMGGGFVSHHGNKQWL